MCSLQLFFHKKNERPSNFPCKSLFTSHLFTHTRHASFYLKKQKYNTRIGRTRHCVALCSLLPCNLTNLRCLPLQDLLIALSWVILSFWGGQKETFHHHVNWATLDAWVIVQLVLLERKKVILQTQLIVSLSNPKCPGELRNDTTRKSKFQ